jgi:hypothetical protein
MHIVGTDLCRRLDIEGEIDTDETAILIKAYFCFWRMTLLSSFAFEPNTLGGSFCLLASCTYCVFGVLMSVRDTLFKCIPTYDCTYQLFVVVVTCV